MKKLWLAIKNWLFTQPEPEPERERIPPTLNGFTPPRPMPPAPRPAPSRLVPYAGGGNPPDGRLVPHVNPNLTGTAVVDYTALGTGVALGIGGAVIAHEMQRREEARRDSPSPAPYVPAVNTDWAASSEPPRWEEQASPAPAPVEECRITDVETSRTETFSCPAPEPAPAPYEPPAPSPSYDSGSSSYDSGSSSYDSGSSSSSSDW